MSANSPQPIGSSTIAADISQKEATYLPPSELAIKYAKGLHNHVPATPHPSLTAEGSNPHLIKKVESFYVRPRWLFVRVSGLLLDPRRSVC
jgi:galactonate dehydratase